MFGMLVACSGRSSTMTSPDAGVPMDADIDKNAECCALWTAGGDGLDFFQKCAPTTWNTCVTYNCGTTPPAEVCTGVPPADAAS
jgi:hypothetical protein